MDKKEFLKRRVDDFNVVDNTLRDMADITTGERKESVVKAIIILYDLFEMPHNEYDEKVLDDIRNKFK